MGECCRGYKGEISSLDVQVVVYVNPYNHVLFRVSFYLVQLEL